MADGRPHGVCGGFSKSLKTLVHIIYCFILMYLFLLLFLVPIALMLCYRFILSLIFATFYKGRYKLIESSNACYGLDRYANVLTLYFFMYINGPCDIEVLRQRIHQTFTTFKGKNGSRPYELMLCGLVKKCGFHCWENMRDSFDINEHIRYLPGCSDPDRIYTETEVFEAAASLADDIWPECRPKWEFLVVPKLRKDDTGEICSAIHFRLQHIYGDGISTAQLIRLCVADKPAVEFSFDPVKPPIPPRPLWMKLVIFLQVIFLGPWAALRLMMNKKDHILYEGPLMGGKYFGRTKLEIPINKMKDIRKAYGCTTSSVLHFALTGALQKMTLKKGFPVPDEILGSLVFALLPYSNEYPRNNAILIADNFPISVGKQSLRERLARIDKICRRTTNPMNYYAIVTSKLFMKMVGVFPAAMVEKSMSSWKLSYCVSNVPGTSETMYFNGNNVTDLFGVGPLINGFRYCTGVGCYQDKFVFGFQCENSNLIKNQEDFNDLIWECEHEIQVLMDNIHSSQC